MRPRIGVSTLVGDARGWTAWCRRLEDVGVDEISVADHLKAGVLPPLPALAAAAAVTERVGLSTMVLNNELRHPAVLANEVALLAELSAGRFTLGIGAGHAEDEHAAIGQPLPPPADRVARLEESVQALRRLLAGETVTTDGEHLRLTDAVAAPAPTHPIPLLVGGGSRSVLRVAARHADIVGLTGFSHVEGVSKLTHFTAAGLEDRLTFIHGLERRRPEPLRLQALIQLVRVTDDRRATANELADEFPGDVGVDTLLDSPFLLLGTVDEIATQVHQRGADYGIDTWTVFAGRPIDAPIDELARVAAAIHAG